MYGVRQPFELFGVAGGVVAGGHIVTFAQPIDEARNEGAFAAAQA